MLSCRYREVCCKLYDEGFTWNTSVSVINEDMWSWCEKNKNLAQNVNISFKGSGTDYYAKFGLRTILGESNKQELFEDRLALNEIISKEYKILQKHNSVMGI